MKLFVTLLAALFSTLALADNHRPNSKYYGFYHFIAPDPAAVVAATDKFYASDCGKAYPADVGLAEEVFNGAYQSTHFFINTYQNAEDQQKAAEIFRSCPSGLEFLADLNAAGVIPTREYLGFALIEEGDWNQDMVFAKFDVIIEPQNQRAYAAAYAKMMSAAAEDVGLRSWGNDLVGFGNDMFTNWVYLGAENLVQLDQIQQALFAHPAYATFAQETSGMRVNVNTTQLQFLKAYARQD